MKPENIIFHFGGVLVDWSPGYVYKDYFKEDSETEHFLKNICTEEWNLEQDRGRTLSEGTTCCKISFRNISH